MREESFREGFFCLVKAPKPGSVAVFRQHLRASQMLNTRLGTPNSPHACVDSRLLGSSGTLMEAQPNMLCGRMTDML